MRNEDRKPPKNLRLTLVEPSVSQDADSTNSHSSSANSTNSEYNIHVASTTV